MNNQQRFRMAIADELDLELMQKLQHIAKKEGLKTAIPQVANYVCTGIEGLNGKDAVSKSTDLTDKAMQLNWDGTEINTVEGLIAAANVDTSIWRVAGFRCSTWQQSSKKQGVKQLWSVKARFERISPIETGITEAVGGLMEELRGMSKPAKPVKSETEKAAIINIYDAHIDKITLLEETGKESDLERNIERFKEHFTRQLNAAKGCAVVYFPVGSDFINVNDARNTTKKGTPQDAHHHVATVFKKALGLLMWCLEQLKSNFPEVHVPVIQGNHDEDIASMLGHALAAFYEAVTNVNINDSRLQRKYYQYGQNMIVFDHGDKVKPVRLPMVIADEQPAMWAATSNRICLRGHTHHKEEFQFSRTKDAVGVTIKHLRAISNPSKWGTDNGWIGTPKSSTLIMLSKDGLEQDEKTITLKS